MKEQRSDTLPKTIFQCQKHLSLSRYQKHILHIGTVYRKHLKKICQNVKNDPISQTTKIGLPHGNLTATSRKQPIKNECQNDKKRPQC